MDTLIQINQNAQGASVVSARELHGFLEVKTPLEKWIKRMSEYGFTQGVDFQQLDKIVQIGNGGKRTIIDDFALTLDMAKELSMIQRSEKGKAARQYFIDCEKQLRVVAAQPLPAATDPMVLQILQNQTQLLAGQQQQIDYIRTEQQQQIDQLRADMALIQSGQRPDRRQTRYKPPMPGVRPLWPEQERTLGLRGQINQRVNEYCEQIGASQSETYKYLYGRMQSIFGLNVYNLSRRGNESMLDAIDRYGYLNRLYSVVMSELAYRG
ncbi:antA/AntB antirepressor family protein [Fibrella sp. ES10-3-2-2]|nr:hypothetical protein A6C57_01080 [Fibrella sp. ES10-3-2-2]